MKAPTLEIELRGDRLIMHQRVGTTKMEVDVTPVWNFARLALNRKEV